MNTSPGSIFGVVFVARQRGGQPKAIISLIADWVSAASFNAVSAFPRGLELSWTIAADGKLHIWTEPERQAEIIVSARFRPEKSAAFQDTVRGAVKHVPDKSSSKPGPRVKSDVVLVSFFTNAPSSSSVGWVLDRVSQHLRNRLPGIRVHYPRKAR